MPADSTSRRTPIWHVLCRELKHVEEVLALGRDEHHRRFCRVAPLRPRGADGPRKGRGNLPGHAADPEAGRGGHLPADCRCQARRPPGPQPGRRGLLCPAADSLRGRHVAECGQPVDGRLAARAWRPPRHGGLRLRSPPADRTGRGRSVGRTGSRRLPAHAVVPYGALHFRHRGGWPPGDCPNFRQRHATIGDDGCGENGTVPFGHAHARGRRPPAAAPCRRRAASPA